METFFNFWKYIKNMLSILTIFKKNYFIAYPKKYLIISLVNKSDFQGFLFQFCQVGELDRCHPEPAQSAYRCITKMDLNVTHFSSTQNEYELLFTSIIELSTWMHDKMDLHITHFSSTQRMNIDNFSSTQKEI